MDTPLSADNIYQQFARTDRNNNTPATHLITSNHKKQCKKRCVSATTESIKNRVSTRGKERRPWQQGSLDRTGVSLCSHRLGTVAAFDVSKRQIDLHSSSRSNTARARDSQGARPCSTRRSRSTQRSNKQQSTDGDIVVRLQVHDISLESSQTNSVTALSEKVLTLYNFVTSNKAEYLASLNALKLHDHMQFKDVRVGSILLTVQCQSHGALDTLEDLYASQQLSQLLNDVLITPHLRNALDVSRLSLEVTIPQHSLDNCRDYLITQDILQASLADGVSNAVMTHAEMVQKLQDLCRNLHLQIESVSAQYQQFCPYLEEFLMVLKLSKAADVHTFTCLQDVVACHDFLVKSYSVGRSVRTDFVRSFLDMIEQIRCCAEAASHEILECERYMLLCNVREEVKSVKTGIQRLRLMLSLNTQFSHQDNQSSSKLNALDRQIFSALHNYLPNLLSEFSCISKAIHTLKNKFAHSEFEQTAMQPSHCALQPAQHSQDDQRPTQHSQHKLPPAPHSHGDTQPTQYSQRNLRPTQSGQHDLPSAQSDQHDLPSAQNDQHDLPSAQNDQHDLPSAQSDQHDLPSAQFSQHDLPSAQSDQHDLPSAQFSQLYTQQMSAQSNLQSVQPGADDSRPALHHHQHQRPTWHRQQRQQLASYAQHNQSTSNLQLLSYDRAGCQLVTQTLERTFAAWPPAGTPVSHTGSSGRPANNAGSSGTPANKAGSSGTPAKNAGSSDTPANNTGSSGTPANNAGSPGTPANNTGSSGTPANNAGSSGTPANNAESLDTSANITGSSGTPTNHAGFSDIPPNHATLSDTPAYHTGSSDAPANLTGSSDAPANYTGSSDAPANHAGSSDAPANHTGSSDAPVNHTGSSDAPANHTGSSDALANHTESSDAPANHTGASDAPANHTGASDAPANHTDLHETHKHKHTSTSTQLHSTKQYKDLPIATGFALDSQERSRAGKLFFSQSSYVNTWSNHPNKLLIEAHSGTDPTTGTASRGSPKSPSPRPGTASRSSSKSSRPKSSTASTYLPSNTSERPALTSCSLVVEQGLDLCVAARASRSQPGLLKSASLYEIHEHHALTAISCSSFLSERMPPTSWRGAMPSRPHSSVSTACRKHVVNLATQLSNVSLAGSVRAKNASLAGHARMRIKRGLTSSLRPTHVQDFEQTIRPTNRPRLTGGIDGKKACWTPVSRPARSASDDISLTDKLRRALAACDIKSETSGLNTSHNEPNISSDSLLHRSPTTQGSSSSDSLAMRGCVLRRSGSQSQDRTAQASVSIADLTAKIQVTTNRSKSLTVKIPLA